MLHFSFQALALALALPLPLLADANPRSASATAATLATNNFNLASQTVTPTMVFMIGPVGRWQPFESSLDLGPCACATQPCSVRLISPG